MGCCAGSEKKQEKEKSMSEVVNASSNVKNDTNNTINELPNGEMNGKHLDTIPDISNPTPIVPQIPIIKPGSTPVLNLNDKSDKEQEIERLISLHEEHLTIKGIYNKYASVKPKENPNDEVFMNREDLSKALKYLGLQTTHLEPDEKYKIYKFFNLDINNKIDNHDELEHYANGYIDFFDFSSSLAALVSGDDDDATYIMFICIDHNNDGKLDIEDLAQLLLIENQLLLIINHEDQHTELSKERAKRHAKRLYKYCKEKTIRLSQFEKEDAFDETINFTEYLSARAFKDDKKMGFDNNKSQEIPIDKL